MVIGGHAVLIYGESRLTQDIDVTVGVDADQIERVKQVISKLHFKILVENPESFVKKTMVLPALDEKSGIRIDFIFSDSTYEKQALKRTKSVTMDGVGVRFASLEDLIVHKIVAGRPRDLEDARGILVRNKKRDEKYIRKWLSKMGKVLDHDLLKVYSSLFK